MERINCGEVDKVIWGLHRVTAATQSVSNGRDNLINYLKNNEYRLNYEEIKVRKFYKDSGAIESANKFICHPRVKRSGAWWYEKNANKMILLRCARINRKFQDAFQTAMMRIREKNHLPTFI